MKNKKSKSKKQKVKKEIVEEGYPKQLAREHYLLVLFGMLIKKNMLKN